jgi:hypothetical protein
MVKMHPDAHGTEKEGLQAVGKSQGGWNTKIPAVTVGERGMGAFGCPGEPSRMRWKGGCSWRSIGRLAYTINRLMDRAYESERTRFRAGEVGFNPVVPTKGSRVCPWEYAMERYKRRNELERFFLRLKWISKDLHPL